MGAALAALLASAAAHAQGHGDAKKEALERADAAPDATVPDGAAPAASAAPERARDRSERRRAEVARVRARWGALVRIEPARAELEAHALRVAKLDAMDRVARSSGKAALLPRIARVREIEEARHERRMKAILDGKDGG